MHTLRYITTEVGLVSCLIAAVATYIIDGQNHFTDAAVFGATLGYSFGFGADLLGSLNKKKGLEHQLDVSNTESLNG